MRKTQSLQSCDADPLNSFLRGIGKCSSVNVYAFEYFFTSNALNYPTYR
jgi:hypothetical protein